MDNKIIFMLFKMHNHDEEMFYNACLNSDLDRVKEMIDRYGKDNLIHDDLLSDIMKKDNVKLMTYILSLDFPIKNEYCSDDMISELLWDCKSLDMLKLIVEHPLCNLNYDNQSAFSRYLNNGLKELAKYMLHHEKFDVKYRKKLIDTCTTRELEIYFTHPLIRQSNKFRHLIIFHLERYEYEDAINIINELNKYVEEDFNKFDYEYNATIIRTPAKYNKYRKNKTIDAPFKTQIDS